MYRILAVILIMVMLMPAAQAGSYLSITNFEMTPTENGTGMSWDYEGDLIPTSWEVYAYYIEPCFEEIIRENIGLDRMYTINWDKDRSKMLEVRGYLDETDKSRASAIIMPLLSDNFLSDEFLATANSDSHAAEKLARPNVRLSVTENTLEASWDPIEWSSAPDSNYNLIYQFYLRNITDDCFVTRGNTESCNYTLNLEPGKEYRFAVVAMPMFDSVIGYMYGDHWYVGSFTAKNGAAVEEIGLNKDAAAEPNPYVRGFDMSRATAMAGEDVEFQLDIADAKEGDVLTVMFRADDWTETFACTYPDTTFNRAFSQAGERNISFKVCGVNGKELDGDYCAPQTLLVQEIAPTAAPEIIPEEPNGILNINETAPIDANGRMKISNKGVTLKPHYYLNAGATAQDADILKKVIRQFDVMNNYQPDGGTTYCNFFAGNVSRAMGAFLPGAGDSICMNCYGIAHISNDYTGWEKIITEQGLYCNCGDTWKVSVPFNTKGRSSWADVGKKKAADGNYHADLTKWFIEKSAGFGWEVINDYTADNYANITDSTAKLKQETIQRAISYANQGYLVVGMRSDWDTSKNNISGHAFIVYPNEDTSTLYTVQAGASGVNRENKPDGGKTRSSDNGWNVYFVFKGIN